MTTPEDKEPEPITLPELMGQIPEMQKQAETTQQQISEIHKIIKVNEQRLIYLCKREIKREKKENPLDWKPTEEKKEK